MTDFNDFIGEAKRIEAVDYPAIAARISVPVPNLYALTDVECRSSGFDSKGRPAMLFEPHLFYRNLSGAERDRAVKAGLAYAKWKPGSYPNDSYPRLAKAMAINETAALKSASWGLGQILGDNHKGAGFDSPQEMVLAFMDDEDNQLEAIAEFLVSEGIDDDLREGRWATVARVWNGPAYAQQGYDKKLAAAFAKRSVMMPSAPAVMPVDSETTKAVQVRLRVLGYPEVGLADGKWGSKTRGAVLAFRADHGLPLLPIIDDTLTAALFRAAPRPVSEERATATVDDLREAGSATIASADKTSAGAVAVTGIGAAAGIGDLLGLFNDQASAAQGLLDKLGPMKETLITLGPWVLVAAGGYIAYNAYKVRQTRLYDHRTGKTAAPMGM